MAAKESSTNSVPASEPPALRRGLGLSTKFVALVGGILLCALGVLSYVTAHEEAQRLYDNLEEKGRELGNFIALISPEPLLAFDFETLNSYVEQIGHGQDVVYAVLFDPTGKNLTSHLQREHPLVRRTLESVGKNSVAAVVGELRTQPQMIHLEFPVRRDDRMLATVVIGLTRERIQQLSYSSIARHMMLNGLVIALIGACIYVVFRINAMRPIRALIQGARRVTHKDLATPVRVYAHDEIGELSDAFNRMMRELSTTLGEKDDAMTQLQVLNRTLEQRVAERTEELMRSEVRFRSIVDNLGEGIITLDAKGYVVSMNPAAERIFRVRSADATGTHSALLLEDRHTRELVEATGYDDDSHSPFRISKTTQPEEYLGRRFDGAIFPMEVVVTAMRVGDQKLRVCILRDVTRRKETERRLDDAQQQLVDAAHKSGMAEMATGVLHNIGNILNSVMLSGEEIARVVRGSRIAGLQRANELLQQHRHDLAEFLARDEKGRALPQYYITVGQVLAEEHQIIEREVASLNEKTAMMKDVIATQQTYARAGVFAEKLEIAGIIEDALRVQESSLIKWGVQIERKFAAVPRCVVHKSKLLQVFTNLIKNAREAMVENPARGIPMKLCIELERFNSDHACVRVSDNGCGIAPDQLTGIFQHGFTTKTDGHGFGLHSSSLAMREMGGELRATSEGVGKGSQFIVVIPLARDDAREHQPPVRQSA